MWKSHSKGLLSAYCSSLGIDNFGAGVLYAIGQCIQFFDRETDTWSGL